MGLLRAFGRLGLITMSVILWVVLVLIVLRHISLQHIYAEFEHPIFHNLPWIIVQNSELPDTVGLTSEGFQKLKRESPQKEQSWLWHLPIQRTRDGVWVAFPMVKLEERTNGSGWLSYQTWDELQKLDAGYNVHCTSTDVCPFRGKGLKLMRLEDILTQYQDQKYVFQIFAGHVNETKQLFNTILTAQWQDNSVIWSPSQHLLHTLRKKQDQWILSMDHATMTFALMLSSVKMEALSGLGGEVAFIDAKHFSSPEFADLYTELQRRQKKVVFIDDPSIQNNELLAEKHLSGVLTSRPTYFHRPTK